LAAIGNEFLRKRLTELALASVLAVDPVESELLGQILLGVVDGDRGGVLSDRDVFIKEGIP
jgi:hypothetical protein